MRVGHHAAVRLLDDLGDPNAVLSVSDTFSKWP